MIPHCFQDFHEDQAFLQQCSDWELLKEWNLAVVYRVHHPELGSCIIKWGGAEMAVEGRIYNELVHPLKLPAPKIYRFSEMNTSCMLILDDIGKFNLEQKPHPDYFIKAAIMLAQLRSLATQNMHHLSDDMITRHTVAKDHFISNLHDISIKLQTAEQQSVINQLKHLLPNHLTNLYNQVPLTIVHHDYMAKNLMINYEDDITAIDWSIGYLSPHLGDLYNLIKEAKWLAHLERDVLIKAYISEYKVDMHTLDWEITIGGICWLIKTLRWLTYGGTEIIPGSDAWVPDLFHDLTKLNSHLYECHNQ